MRPCWSGYPDRNPDDDWTVVTTHEGSCQWKHSVAVH